MLIIKGIEINICKDRLDAISFHATILRSYIEIIDILLKMGADVNKYDSTKIAPLDSATAGDNLEIIKFLLEWGANVGYWGYDNLTVYQWAFRSG